MAALTAPKRHFRFTPEADTPLSITTPITSIIPITVIEVTRITGVAKELGRLGLGRCRGSVIADPWLYYLTAGNHFTKQNADVLCLHPD